MKHIVITSFLLFFIFNAQAEIRFEPYEGVGYSVSSDFSKKHFFTGALGMRTGYELLFGTHIGIDVFWNHFMTRNESAVTIKKTQSDIRGFAQSMRNSTYLSDLFDLSGRQNFTAWSVGIYGAMDLPIVNNATGTFFYTFGNKNISYEGYGLKASVTLITLFRVQLNLDAQLAQYFCPYIEEKSNNDNQQNNDKCTDFQIVSAILSVSFPFRLDIL